MLACLALTVLYIYESVLNSFPHINPAFTSTTVHSVGLITLLLLLYVSKLGRSNPLGLVVGFAALGFGLMETQRAQFSNYFGLQKAC